jgi:hypothetical protein
MYIVAYATVTPQQKEDDTWTDHWRPFETLPDAREFYAIVVQEEENLYVASITAVVESTDYLPAATMDVRDGGRWWKVGDRVVVRDGSEADGDHGVVFGLCHDGSVLVELDEHESLWPCYSVELEAEEPGSRSDGLGTSAQPTGRSQSGR